jgi:hypothetical protein
MTDPIIPPGPSGAGPIDATSADDEATLPVNNEDLDEGETADDRETVDQDVAEASAANERLNDEDHPGDDPTRRRE